MTNLSTSELMKHLKPVSGAAVELSDPERRALQRRLTGVLADIDRVCRANGISYFLSGGTALGAVRHGGFIPWDDDLDVNFARAEFDRFVPAFRAACGDRYVLREPRDARTNGTLLPRVRLKGTSVRDRLDIGETDCGAFADIFVFENAFDNAVLRRIHGLGSLALGLLVSVRKFWRDRKGLLELLAGNPAAVRAVRIKSALGFLVAWLPMDACVHLANSWNGLCRNGRSRYVTCPSGRKHYFGEMGLRADLCETEDIGFEGLTVMISRGVGSYLAKLCGPDYMTPPPAARRERHLFLRPFSI